VGHFKDEKLMIALRDDRNVAQFLSFAPDMSFRHSAVRGFELDSYLPPTFSDLLKVCGSVNVRSFDPEDPKSREFVYGLTNADEVAQHVRRLTSEGLHVIVNETVDVNDGGVSGVVFAGVVEFAPGDTPRCVEKPGACRLPVWAAVDILGKVYGRGLGLWLEDRPTYERTEFSFHPNRVGYYHDRVVIWETERFADVPESDDTIGPWPNRFSQLVGDKAYGLLVADAIGCRVPSTVALPRAAQAFIIGDPGDVISGEELWLRTAPSIARPGLYETVRGWQDPFKMMERAGDEVASLLLQNGVDAECAGAAMSDGDQILIEGVWGVGDDFMLGETPNELPPHVRRVVTDRMLYLTQRFGAVRMEWAVDYSHKLWTLQLHPNAPKVSSTVIVEGDPTTWVDFDVNEGLDALRKLIGDVGQNEHGTVGIALVGRQVGVTSHFGDVLRKARIPSRIGG
jgi:hypothetical protein